MEYLWVTQLCIDQENEVEKASQVQAIGKSFGGARLVIAWLGAEDSHGCITWFVLERALIHREDLRAKGRQNHFVDFSPIEVYRSPIREFLSRSYWSRPWIIQ
jgi:hypothetical protein